MRPEAPCLELSSSHELCRGDELCRRHDVKRPFSLNSGAESRRETSPFRRLLSAFGVLLFVAGTTTGCMLPTPADKASDAARALNMAARWGRMDEAADLTADKDRAAFTKRHSAWHGKVHIVETELAGMTMHSATHATVQVDVSWNFQDDPTLRVTRLEQKWSDADGKWVMLSEKKKDGDPGLFGEPVEKADKTKDRHFPSRVIH